MWILWALLGALIGAAAAQRKGFSTLGGVIGGALLGPFAVLLFLVDGIVSKSEKRVKCPHCAEWIRPEAKVCPHCQRDIHPAA
ncbi:MAG: hypothetical protein EPN53_00955 [Acidobacteria bacterium]|nr:MAG: hypothetical protein EPN53_00955 [Acidobacteriota bacterium]